MTFLKLRRRPRRVLVHGLLHAGTMFAAMMGGDGWRFRYFPDSGFGNFAAMAFELRFCDIVYQIGGRLDTGKFLRAARLLGKEKIVMHWAGSDVLDERQKDGRLEPWVAEKIHHWAVSDWIMQEARSFGLKCQQVPLPSSKIPNHAPPLPEEFSVLTYVPEVSRGHLYGLDRILEVARELPEIPFELVGLVAGRIPDPPPNLKIHARVADLTNFYKRASVVLRPVRHDGLSCMVMEGLGYGRQVLWTYSFPGCVRIATAAEARDEIARLYALHQQKTMELNSMGLRALAEGGYLPEQARGLILSRLEKILDA